MAPPKDIREKFGRFRILVVGRANAGKTTLLQRVCNTTEKPEIFDSQGQKINATIVQSSVNRGYHNIKNELVFRSNPNFVFHDSCGFEAGGEDEFKKMKEFVLERASTAKLKERIHAIWYCIPMDEYSRAITKAEERFFSECDTNMVPVIAVFTKFDALWDDAYEQLKESGLPRRECLQRAPEFAKEIFANMKIWDRLCNTQYPPKDHIHLAEMEKDHADCVPLLEATTNALGEEAMQILLISTQRTNLALCIKYAVQNVLLVYIRKAQWSYWLSKDTCIEMQQKIATWFPHMKDFGDQFGGALDPDLFKLTDVEHNNNTRQSADMHITKLSFSPLTQTLQLGIAMAIILEHSFFLFQQGNHPEQSLDLAASEYVSSQTPAAVKEAVKAILHQLESDRGEEKLCKTIIDMILQNRTSKVLE